MEVIKYDNILDNDLHIYWQGNEHYDQQTLSAKEYSELNLIAGIRVQMDGAKGEKSSYDKLFTIRYQKLADVIFDFDQPAYLVVIEYSPGVPNKIRSYKGILPKKVLTASSFVEAEFSTSKAGHTLISGVAELTPDNFLDIVPLSGDSRKSFIIQSANEIKSISFLEWLVQNSLNSDNINYITLLKKYCKVNSFVYKMAGDGDHSLGFDILYHKEFEKNILDAVNRLGKI